MLIEGTKVSAIDYIKAIHTIKEIKDEFVSLIASQGKCNCCSNNYYFCTKIK